MEYKEIKKLIDDMGDSKLDSLDIEFPDGIKISMTKNGVNTSKSVIEAPAPIAPPAIIPKEEKHLVEVKKEENHKIIKSPMVGTFYSSSSPDTENFVKIGDKVKKGQVICIVEAMKLMNEIESEFEGEIVQICAKDGDIIEYGMPLFKLK